MGKRIETLLDTYTQAREAQDVFLAHCAAQEAELMTAIPEEIRVALAQVHDARAQQGTALTAEVEALAAQIKSAVGTKGVSVKGTSYHAVYARGRAVWDDAFLQGYAATHEEILQARRETEPSISIRKIKS
jgi:hypothetical protein